jgi:hypothetical protein
MSLKGLEKKVLDTIPVFDGAGDFQSWKFSMRSAFVMNGLWNMLQGKAEGDDEKAAAERELCAISLIHACVGPSLKKTVELAENAKKAWDEICTRYERRDEANLSSLFREFMTKKMNDNDSMARHIDNMKRIVMEIRQQQGTVDEMLYKTTLLESLCKDYTIFRQGLRAHVKTTKIDELHTQLLLEEQARKREKAEEADVAGGTPTALNVTRQAEKETRECYNCGKKGHLKRDCWSNPQRGTQRGGRGSGRGRGGHRGGRGGAGRGGGRQGQRDQWPDDEHPQAYVAEILNVSCATLSGEVLIDSGATHHITNDQSKFVQGTYRLVQSQVMGLDDRPLAIEGQGDMKLCTKDGKELIIKDVLYVPTARHTLVSTGKLIKSGLEVHLTKTGVTVTDGQGRTVLNATEKNQLPVIETASCASAEVKTDAALLHCRLGHPGKRRQDIATGTHLDEDCEVCIKAKMTKAPAVKSVDEQSASKAKKRLEIISMDLAGPLQPDMHGRKYVMAINDNFTRANWVYLLKSKAEMIDVFKSFHKEVTTRTGDVIKRVHTDNESIFNSKEMHDFCAQHGIEKTFTVPYNPAQNGITERFNRTVFTTARALLLTADLGHKYWGYAVETASYLLNRLPSAAIDNRTPYEAWAGIKPRLEHLRVFGCDAFVHSKQGKLGERAVKGKFIGYDRVRKGYLVHLETGSIVTTRDVKFIEKAALNGGGDVELQAPTPPQEPAAQEPHHAVLQVPADDDDDDGDAPARQQADIEAVAEQAGAAAPKEAPLPQQQQQPRRSERLQERQRQQQQRQAGADSKSDDAPAPAEREYPAASTVSVKEAIDDPDWRKAMDEEMKAHRDNGTWQVVKKPAGAHVLPTKWVLRQKDDGRFKARLVARGDLQREEEYFETYAPVARETTIRIVMAITAKEDFKWEQLDVKTAYLNGDVDTEIYIAPPKGYENEFGDCVLKLKKALYGLKQAGLKWNETITKYLCSIGFKQSAHDPCLFLRMDKDNKLTGMVALYVDDILLSCRDAALLKEVHNGLVRRFLMNLLGEPRSYLGMDIERSARGIKLSLRSYIDKVLKKFGMDSAKPQATPCAKRPEPRAEHEEQVSVADMREAIGTLLYLARMARPDIACVIGQLARFQTDPGREHMVAIKRVLRYLKGTRDAHLFFPAASKPELQLQGYSDSDYAGDVATRRSTGGFIFFLGGAAISWRSKLQAGVALSSTEGEYVALSVAAQEAIYLRNLLKELGVCSDKPTVIYEDNQAAIAIARSAQYHGRLKHVDVRAHFVRDQVQQGQILIEYCPTDKMVADIMTKPLPKPAHQYMTKCLFGGLPEQARAQ